MKNIVPIILLLFLSLNIVAKPKAKNKQKKEEKVEIGIAEIPLEIGCHLTLGHSLMLGNLLHELFKLILGSDRYKPIQEGLWNLHRASFVKVHEKQHSLLVMPWQSIRFELVHINV